MAGCCENCGLSGISFEPCRCNLPPLLYSLTETGLETAANIAWVVCVGLLVFLGVLLFVYLN